MHNGATLDVLNVIERLEGGGVPHDQAKVQAAVLIDVVTGKCRCMDARYVWREELGAALLPLRSGIRTIDTKVEHLTVEIRATAEKLGMRIDKSAAELKYEIIKWILSLWFLQGGLFAAVLFKVTT